MVASSSKVGIQHLHDWTLAFASTHMLSLNATKSEYVFDGPTIDQADLKIGNTPLRVLDSKSAVKYLGLVLRADGDVSDVVSKLDAQLRKTLGLLRYRRVPLDVGIRIITQHLIPKLSFAMQHVHFTDQKLQQWNVLIMSYVRRLMLSRTVANDLLRTVFRIPDLTRFNAICMLSEAVIHLNSNAGRFLRHVLSPVLQQFGSRRFARVCKHKYLKKCVCCCTQTEGHNTAQ